MDSDNEQHYLCSCASSATNLCTDKTPFFPHNLSVCTYVFCLPPSVLWKDRTWSALLPLCMLLVSWQKTSRLQEHTHTYEHLPPSSPLRAFSFIRGWIDQSQGKERELQRHFPLPQRELCFQARRLCFGPWVESGGWTVNSGTVFDRTVNSYVYHTHRVTTKHTHTRACASFHVIEFQMPDVILHSGLASCFPHLHAQKHLFFTHATPPTQPHTQHFSPVLEIVCHTQTSCWRDQVLSGRITLRLMNKLYCVCLSADRVKNIHVFVCFGGPSSCSLSKQNSSGPEAI